MFTYLKKRMPWMLLCRPITIPTNVTGQTMLSTDKCRIVTVSPTNDKSRFVIDLVEDAPEIYVNPDKDGDIFKVNALDTLRQQ